MKELTIFEFQGQKLRVIEHNGKPSFISKEVCKVLGIANHRDAISRLSPHQKDDVGIADAMGRMQKTNIISEGGLYKLALRSNKPEAEAFADLVVDVILPSIRETGSYLVDQQPQNILETLADPKQLREAIEDLEDKALSIRKTLQFLKTGEDMLFPGQSRTRGKRTVLPVKLIKTKSGKVVEQYLLLFEQ